MISPWLQSYAQNHERSLTVVEGKAEKEANERQNEASGLQNEASDGRNEASACQLCFDLAYIVLIRTEQAST
jgi:hypothetical protein